MFKINVTGNVGYNPETKSNAKGDIFVLLDLAVTIGKGKTEWIKIVFNDKLAETARQHIKTGMRILVEGFPMISKWKNKDGEPMAKLEVRAHFLEILSSKKDEGLA